MQKSSHYFGDILGVNFPICTRFGTMPCKFGRDTSRHDVAHSHIVVSLIQHHRFTKSVQSELRRVIRGASCKRVLASKTADIHDVATAPLLKSGKRFTAAVKHT